MSYKDMVNNARRSGATKILSPTFFEWKKVNDMVVGKFLEASPIKSTLAEGEYNHYIFETDEGLFKFALGAATDKEAGVLMQSNHVYIITYQGKVEISGGRRVNKFTVEEILDLDETPPIEGAEPKKESKRS